MYPNIDDAKHIDVIYEGELPCDADPADYLPIQSVIHGEVIA